MKRILVILTVLILATVSCQATGAIQQPAPPIASSNNAQPQELYNPPEPGSLSALYENTLPGVVSIRVFSDAGSGSGSGFVLMSKGIF